MPDPLTDHATDAGVAEPDVQSGALHFARMAGSSIAGLDAAPWVTDFLNAAYYHRAPAERDVDDLRLAFCVLTTYWYREPGRRLHLGDLPAFSKAFGHARLSTTNSARGTLDRDELLEGAARLLGDWFPEAYADDARRGWGIAFRSPGTGRATTRGTAWRWPGSGD